MAELYKVNKLVSTLICRMQVSCYSFEYISLSSCIRFLFKVNSIHKYMNHPELVHMETGTDGQSTEAHTAESGFCLPKRIRKEYDFQGLAEPLPSSVSIVCSNNHS